MREVVLRPRAHDDLESIWLYTFDRWGQEQAARYLRRLNERIVELATSPELGKSLEAIREGYHSSESGGMSSSTPTPISGLASSGSSTTRWT